MLANSVPTQRLQRWSTDAVSPEQRLDYWVGAVCEGFLEMDVRSSQSVFAAELRSAPLGAITLNAVRGSAQDVYRTRRAIARSEQNYYYLLCKHDEAWTAAQGDQRTRLLPGDLLLVDSRRCYEFHFPTSCNTGSIELPTAWLEQWLPDAERRVGQRIDGQQGFGLALSAFTRALQPELGLQTPLPATVLTDQLGALLALSLPGAEAPRASIDHHPRIVQAIAERHAQAGLSAAEVAMAVGMSARSLHRSLAAAGLTFAGELMRLRMAQAGRLLGDARFDHLSLGEIGRRVGLLDASHFVRVYRRTTGQTPGTTRRQRRN
ncbi:MAG: helix-turn-helix domain-containing protein [Hydrogenophaga sp.]|uniref:AraC-like ligand-binding domain-containing protein n=1 Tax=Hydrogenophaga sp. TaxID=1904254 RepID=UPI001D93883E|nr:helix-turn-helix domain-containing protein [Hydrogenophaga sp.]MBX3608778.1 helix-turn-helix domain-containing protein [Hydrogenophaga sp.]